MPLVRLNEDFDLGRNDSCAPFAERSGASQFRSLLLQKTRHFDVNSRPRLVASFAAALLAQVGDADAAQ
jgi:hypothetical protein